MWTLLGLAAWLTVFVPGCGYKSTRPSAGTGQSGGAGQTQYRADVLKSAVSMLNAPERFDDEQKWSESIVDQLNQWMRMVRSAADAKKETVTAESKREKTEKSGLPSAVAWQRDPLIETLPEPVRRLRWIRGLGREVFDPNYDGTFLREAVLLRDVANHVQPAEPNDLAMAEALFDWTMRNIQIESPPLDDATPEEQWLGLRLPMETLFYGCGTPLGRAWVFMLLARQRGLDAVLLATPHPRNAEQARPWAVGLVSGDDIYLFDYTYGLPIPGPDGEGIATLAQAAADDAVLRQMDIPGGRIYPRKAADLEKAIVPIEASPGYLSRRMKLLESHLTGRDRIVLSTSPSTLADRLKGMENVGEVRLWTMPYQVLAGRQQLLNVAQGSPSAQQQAAAAVLQASAMERLPFTLPAAPEESKSQQQQQQLDDARRRERPVLALRLGRLLHLRGVYGGGDPQRLADQEDDEENLSEVVQRGAKYYYLRAMPTRQELENWARMQREGYEQAPNRPVTKELTDSLQQMRDDAAYWLGLIWFAQGGYETAAQFLGPMTLESHSNNPWTNGARYNLARCYEAQNKLPEAIELLEADRSPQRYGNRLRAHWLEERRIPSPKP